MYREHDSGDRRVENSDRCIGELPTTCATRRMIENRPVLLRQVATISSPSREPATRAQFTGAERERATLELPPAGPSLTGGESALPAAASALHGGAITEPRDAARRDARESGRAACTSGGPADRIVRGGSDVVLSRRVSPACGVAVEPYRRRQPRTKRFANSGRRY